MVVFFLFTGVGQKTPRLLSGYRDTKKTFVLTKKKFFCYLCTKIIILEEEE